MTFLFVVLYLLVGGCLLYTRILDIAVEIHMHDDPDLSTVIAILLRWVLTWPAWVGR